MININHMNYLNSGKDIILYTIMDKELIIGEAIIVMILHGGVFKIYKIHIM